MFPRLSDKSLYSSDPSIEWHCFATVAATQKASLSKNTNVLASGLCKIKLFSAISKCRLP